MLLSKKKISYHYKRENITVMALYTAYIPTWNNLPDKLKKAGNVEAFKTNVMNGLGLRPV